MTNDPYQEGPCTHDDASSFPIGVGETEDGTEFVTYQCRKCRAAWDSEESWDLGDND